MSKTGIFPNDEWTIFAGEAEAGPIFVRCRSAQPSDADKELFSKLILIRWQYDPGDASGLPSPEDMATMEVFEERILDASESDASWGAGVAVITHNGVREWQFYTPDVSVFETQFNEALRDLGPYPLELQVFDDPEWNAFEEFRATS